MISDQLRDELLTFRKKRDWEQSNMRSSNNLILECQLAYPIHVDRRTSHKVLVKYDHVSTFCVKRACETNTVGASNPPYELAYELSGYVLYLSIISSHWLRKISTNTLLKEVCLDCYVYLTTPIKSWILRKVNQQ